MSDNNCNLWEPLSNICSDDLGDPRWWTIWPLGERNFADQELKHIAETIGFGPTVGKNGQDVGARAQSIGHIWRFITRRA